MTRIFLAGIFHETHSFTDDRTGIADFLIHRGQALLDRIGDGSQIDGFLTTAAREGWEVVAAANYLCGASGIDSFHVDSASNFSECPDCHARRSEQRMPMRVCDVLGAYALQMLRGEIEALADHCKSLLHVFEIDFG